MNLRNIDLRTKTVDPDAGKPVEQTAQLKGTATKTAAEKATNTIAATGCGFTKGGALGGKTGGR